MIRRVAVVAVAVSLVAACGGDDTPSPPDSGPSVTFATVPGAGTASPGTDAPGTSTAGSDPGATPATEPAATTPPVDPGDPVIGLSSIGQFREPVDIAWRGDDPTMFVVERGGLIKPVRDGEIGEAVLDITDLTVGQYEQGLLGLTFSADGTLAYVNHTDRSDDTVIAEYAVGDDGTFDESTRRVLLTIEQPYTNHNGGNVTIGPDGMLYIGMGDGGDAGDPLRVSLNMTSLLGKILRIDPTPSADLPYTIPADNPFVGIEGARPEIWTVGLRNPWRMSFDSETGDLWIADVGQGALEEVDVAWAADGAGRGMNFGWSAFEGTEVFNGDQSPDGATPPIYEYRHGDGTGCSISGGAVYRGDAIPALVGWYLFGDFCSGNLYAIEVVDRVLVDSLVVGYQESNVAIRESPTGDLYAVSIFGDVSLVVAG